MRKHPIFPLSVATVVAMSALCGCSPHGSPGGSSGTPPTSAMVSRLAAPLPAALPTPESLVDVLYQLTDPGLASDHKLALVEGTTTQDAAILDRFSTALRNGGYLPMNFEATNIAWSDKDPAAVVAVITVKSLNPESGIFSFPMEFKPCRGSWQLSKKTADWLLTFSNPEGAQLDRVN
ncbi:MAG: hypothetical protein K2Q25_02655 [Mycobacteriaceae bacterium]|nr:hypothetical protein [Mycobacteriaceae bacterium]